MRHLSGLIVLLALGAVFAPAASAQLPFKVGCTGSPRAADPGVLGLPGNGYLLVSTSKVRDGLPIRSSFDGRLWCWSGKTTAFPRKNPSAPALKPKWVSGGGSYWAPEIKLVNDRYLILYSAVRAGTKGKRCLGIGWSADARPENFSRPERPLFCRKGNRYIDPSVFVEGGQTYILYKADRKFPRKGARPLNRKVIVMRRLLKGNTLGGRHKLLQASQPWEKDRPGKIPWPSVEAPTLIHPPGPYYYLFYSGNLFKGRAYGVGVARSTKLFGPYQKYPENPILGGFDKNPNRCALGHQDVSFTLGHGLRLYFHSKPYNANAKPPRCIGKRRYLSFRPFTFSQQGWPQVPEK